MLKKFYNSKYTQIGIYAVIVAAIIIAIYAFIDNVPYFFGLVWDKVAWILKHSKPIIIAVALAYLLDPIADFFENLYAKINFFKKKGKSTRPLAVITVIIILIAVISIVISLLVFSIPDWIKIANFDDLFVIVNQYKDNINNLYDKIMNALAKANIESEGIQEYIKEASMILVQKLSMGAQKTMSYISNISSFITTLFVSFVIMVYLLVDGKRVTGYLRKVSKALLNEKQNNKVRTFVNDVDTVFSGYIRGQFADAFVMMVMVGTGLSIIGVEFAVIIAILTGIGNLIPYVGPFIAYGGVIISSLLAGNMKTFIIAMIFLVIIQTVDGNIIGPKLLSNSIEIHPMLVVIFISFGSAIGGVLGMLLAVPVGALIKVLFVRFVDKRLAEKGIDEDALEDVVVEQGIITNTTVVQDKENNINKTTNKIITNNTENNVKNIPKHVKKNNSKKR